MNPYGFYVDSDATISEDGKYRYDLIRRWSIYRPPALWVMLNPSTADHMEDDPTIRRVIQFTKDRIPVAGGIVVVNLFGLRCTRPVHLLDHPERSEGPDNAAVLDQWLGMDLAAVVCAWGSWVKSNSRAEELAEGPRHRTLTAIVNAGHDPLCLGTTSSREPKHPLYLSGTTQLRPLLAPPATRF